MNNNRLSDEEMNRNLGWYQRWKRDTEMLEKRVKRYQRKAAAANRGYERSRLEVSRKRKAIKHNLAEIDSLHDVISNYDQALDDYITADTRTDTVINNQNDQLAHLQSNIEDLDQTVADQGETIEALKAKLSEATEQGKFYRHGLKVYRRQLEKAGVKPRFMLRIIGEPYDD